MSVDVFIEGVAPASDDYKAKAAAWHALKAADCQIPHELSSYFEHGEPDPVGITTLFGYLDTGDIEAAAEGFIEVVHDNNYNVMEIDLAKIPAKYTVIRLRMG